MAITDELETQEERPCLHCLIIDVIDNYFAEYPVSEEDPDMIDTAEVVTAVAKTIAELTCSQDSVARQKMIDQLTKEVLQYDEEFRQQDMMGSTGSGARH